MELLFWSAAIFVVYTYVGYPAIIIVLAKLGREKVDKADFEPFVSVIIAARNESKTIVSKLNNLCDQDYPKEKIEIIVVSDASEDDTNQLVQSFSDPRVKLIIHAQAVGKAVALNTGVMSSNHEIIVFADARQQFVKNAIKELTANFSAPAVGCVGGELVFRECSASDLSSDMGIYWNYEKLLRISESLTGSMIGVSGCIYAIRKKLFLPLPAGTILDDVLTPMNILRQGYRVVLDQSAVAYDVVSKDVLQEWYRKVRTLAGNWQLIGIASWLFVPWQNDQWFRFVSHKFCRVLVPFALVLMLLANSQLSSGLYTTFLVIQVLTYLTAIAAHIVPALRKCKIISLLYFFAVLNAAVLVGLFYCITNRSGLIWQKKS